MATQTTKTVQLPNMKIAASVLEALKGQVVVGPVKIIAIVHPSVPEVIIEVVVFQVTMQYAKLTPAHPSVEIECARNGCDVDGEITADFTAREVYAEFTVVCPGFRKEWKDVLLRW